MIDAANTNFSSALLSVYNRVKGVYTKVYIWLSFKNRNQMSAKRILAKLYPLHLDNIKSLETAIADTNSEYSIVKTIKPSHLQEHEFMFSIGTDTYLLEFSVSRQHEQASYKTYKIERNPGVFGSFGQRHLPELNIIFRGISNAPFSFTQNQTYTSNNNGNYRSNEVKSSLFDFGKDYLIILIQYEEKAEPTGTVDN